MTITVSNYTWQQGVGITPPFEGTTSSAQLVLIFGGRGTLSSFLASYDLSSHFPNAIIAGCSSAGEICGSKVYDEQVVLSALTFSTSSVRAAIATLDSTESSYAVGLSLTQRLLGEDLRHILILSEGLMINGSALIQGIKDLLPQGVKVTGALAGDGERFEKTCTVFDGAFVDNGVIGIGFYGQELDISYGSKGGWDPFGPERTITKSSGNILYELDHQSALALYKEYLGPYAVQLPASGLLFPLAIRAEHDKESIVRAMLSIHEHDHSMRFAGDMPMGYRARLMKSNPERLLDGAEDAALQAAKYRNSASPDFALIISCVSRKILLRQRIEEEIEVVRTHLGGGTPLIGMYSYGEISPMHREDPCSLHNQTMTITTFSEGSRG